MMTRKNVLAAVFVVFAAASLLIEPAAAGSAASYCISYSQGGMDCSFANLSECEETASGLSAECYPAASTIEQRRANGLSPANGTADPALTSGNRNSSR